MPPDEGPHRYRQELDFAPFLEWHGDAGEAIDFVTRHSGLGAHVPLVPGPRAPGASLIRRLRFGASFAPGPYREVDVPMAHLLADRAAVSAPGEVRYFRAELDPPVRLALHLNPFESPVPLPLATEESAGDDRQLYGHYRAYVRSWLESNGYRDRGLHLFFWKGYSHLALSYSDDRTGEWHRRYVLRLARPGEEAFGEASLDFAVPVSDGDGWAGLSRFCACAGGMEEVAASFGFSWSRRASLLEGMRTALGIAMLFAGVFVLNDMALADAPEAVWPRVTAGLMGALAAGAALMLLRPHETLEVVRLGMRFGRRIRLFPTYGRTLDRMWDAVIGAVVWSVLKLLSLLGILVGVGVGWLLHIGNWWYWAGVGAFAVVMGSMLERDVEAEPAAPLRDEAQS